MTERDADGCARSCNQRGMYGIKISFLTILYLGVWCRSPTSKRDESVTDIEFTYLNEFRGTFSGPRDDPFATLLRRNE